jgi:putative transposase
MSAKALYWANPLPADADQATIEKGVNFPTLQRVIGNTT